MGALFLLNGFLAFAISALLAWGFIKHYKKEHINRSVNWFSVIFFSYVLLFFLHLSWITKWTSFNNLDYTIIFSLAIFVQTLALFKVVYSFTKERKIFFLLLFYLILFLLTSSFPLSSILLIFLIISSLLTLVITFTFLGTSSVCKRVGYLGIIYSCISLLLEFLLFFNIGDLLFSGLLINTVFVVFVFFFLKDVEKFPLRFASHYPTKETSHIILFIKYFVYIIVITNFVLISTVGLHELGHVLVSRHYGCDSRSIAFEEGIYPYSEIVCDDLSSKNQIAISGFAIPVIIAIALFLIGGKFIRPVSFLIIGFNLLASHKDFIELSISSSLLFATTISGMIFLFTGVALLAKSRMDEHHHHPL